MSEEEYYAKMIHSYGSDSYARAAVELNGLWDFSAIKNLSTGQTVDWGPYQQDADRSQILVWDGTSPMTYPTNYVLPWIIDMTPDPSCSGPQIPGR